MLRAKAAAEHVVAKIVDSGRDIQGKIVGGKRPSMKFPLRLLSNVRYTPKRGASRWSGRRRSAPSPRSRLSRRPCAWSRSRSDSSRPTTAPPSATPMRAEPQAFATFDLNYVMDEYLPAKLKHPEKFLP